MSKKTDQTLNKCDELINRLTELKKALGQTNVQSTRKPVNSLPTGWSQDAGTGSFKDSTHGVISTSKHPDGYYQVTHGGRSVGRAGSIGEAGAKIKQYVGSLQTGDTGQQNVNPMTVGKSDYGPKGGGQYNAADNAKRKSTNVGTERFGNQSTKAYSHKNVMADKTPKGPAGPVKQYSPEQIAAINEARKLKKNSEEQPWDRHASVPNADREVERIQKTNPVSRAEELMPNQLANMMANRSMLGIKPPPQLSADEFVRAGEAMGLAPTEEQVQKAESAWGNRMNWLEEAVKPISSRFTSPEEEQAYWDSIKVNGSSRDDYGF